MERLDLAPFGFVACGTRIYYADRVVDRPVPGSVNLQQIVRKRYAEFVFPTFVLRQDALADIGLLDEQIPGSYGEDYDFLLRAARRGPIVAVEQPLVDTFWHQQSFFAQRWQTIVDGLKYLLDKHPELAADPGGRARIEGQAAFAHAALGHRAAACRATSRAPRQPAGAEGLPRTGCSRRHHPGLLGGPARQPAGPQYLSLDPRVSRTSRGA